MNRLTKAMFGTCAEPKLSLFGLQSGRIVMSATEVCRDHLWYNILGEKIGEGSLSGADAQRIAAELLPGELFIVVAVPYDIQILRQMNFVRPPLGSNDREALVPNGLAFFARLAIGRNTLLAPTENNPVARRLQELGIPFIGISQRQLRQIIKAKRDANAAEN